MFLNHVSVVYCAVAVWQTAGRIWSALKLFDSLPAKVCLESFAEFEDLFLFGLAIHPWLCQCIS
jgi:hypothetical protein